MAISNFQDDCRYKPTNSFSCVDPTHVKKLLLPSKMIDKSIRIMEKTIKKYQDFLFLKGTKRDYCLLVEDLIYESTVFPKSRSAVTW